MSDSYREELQRSHMTFNEELNQCGEDARERFGQLGPELTAEHLRQDLTEVIRSSGRHELLKDTALHSLIATLMTIRDPMEFEARIDDVIKHLRDK